MFHLHSAQMGRYQVSRFVEKNSHGYRSPIDRSNKRHGISFMGRIRVGKIPQGLKPKSVLAVYGPTKVVPLNKASEG